LYKLCFLNYVINNPILFPLPPFSNLESFRKLSDAEVGDQNLAPEITFSNAHISGNWKKYGCSFYKAVFKRDKDELQAIIEISAEYPLRPPVFKLSINSIDNPFSISEYVRNKSALSVLATAEEKCKSPEICNNTLKSIEREVNANIADLIKTNENMLLTLQLRKLQMCFDIEIELSRRTKAESLVTTQQQGKLAIRINKGRDRKRPFTFNQKLGVFDFGE